jgi:hypothetical protein
MFGFASLGASAHDSATADLFDHPILLVFKCVDPQQSKPAQ